MGADSAVRREGKVGAAVDGEAACPLEEDGSCVAIVVAPRLCALQKRHADGDGRAMKKIGNPGPAEPDGQSRMYVPIA